MLPGVYVSNLEAMWARGSTGIIVVAVSFDKVAAGDDRGVDVVLADRTDKRLAAENKDKDQGHPVQMEKNSTFLFCLDFLKVPAWLNRHMLDTSLKGHSTRLH